MNTSIHTPQPKKQALNKSLVLLLILVLFLLFALLSIRAIVTAPVEASTMVYGAPIAIHNPVPTENDVFGVSVSIDGDTFVVGAHEYGTAAADAGSAYLYDAATGTLLRTFNNPTPAGQDSFGWSVAHSGGKVLVGAIRDNTGASDAGSAYLFDATTGALLHTFNNPTPAVDDHFGYSVSLAGDKALIGAIHDETGATNAGSAYLFDATTGALLHTFNNPTPAAYEDFGVSVSLSGDKALIGAFHDGFGATDDGSAYLFDTTTGALLRTFNNPTPAANDGFGVSVSISGDKALIGASHDTGATDAGSAYLFDATTGALLHTFNNPTPAAGDVFGVSVSLSGDKALIGTPGDAAGATNAGSAYLFGATTGALLHTFNNPTPAPYDHFGISVSLSGDKVMIGTLEDDTGAANAGSAYLYLLQPDTDGDGIADSADNCPADANADQADTDADGQGNPCDFTPNGDTDGDGIDELVDNCPGVANALQEDNDVDGIGNACDPTPNGETNPNPTSVDQCKQLGWMDFAFSNQGQCVAFVNTGHDSR